MTAVLSDADILKNLDDPKFFIESALWLVDKNRQKIPFVFNPPQNRYYAARSLFDLILKSRKEGFSSLIEAVFLHSCIFGQNENCVTMAHTWDDTLVHLERVQYYLDNLAVGNVKIVVDTGKENQREISFPQTNSRYWIGTAGSKSFGRGRDITKLHLSETAHYQDQQVITSVLEACVPNAWRVMETTANGVGEAFHQLWKEASDPASGSLWKPHFFSWYEDPTNTLPLPEGVRFKLTSTEKQMQDKYRLSLEQVNWYRNKRASMADKALMPQEYPCSAEEAFISSGRHVFSLEKLNIMRSRLKLDPRVLIGDLEDDGRKIRFVDDSEGYLKIWKMPSHARRYLISADVAEGVPNGNYSVAAVVDRSSWDVVATLRCRINPGEWGRMLVTLAYFYENAVIAPENNSLGQGTIEAIRETAYPHLLKTSDLWGEKENVKDGFPTNDKTRNLAISALRTAIDEETIALHDSAFIDELETFVVDDHGRFVPLKGCHDDCVLTLAIAAYCLKFLTIDETYADRTKDVRIGRFNTTMAMGNSREHHGRRRATG